MMIDPLYQQPQAGGPMSLQEYVQLNQSSPFVKYEYLDGVARLMAGGSAEHDRIAYNTRFALDQNFMSGPCTVFGSDVQTLISTKPDGREQYVYPDVTISCDVADRRRGVKLIRTPRLVVEVLSPSTESIDRGTKLAAYQACSSIQEIVLISQFTQYVEVYLRDEEESARWHRICYGPGDHVMLASIDVHFAIDELYKGINFDEPLIEE